VIYQQEHRELMRTVSRLIASEIAPHVEEWEATEAFPAHAVFKLFGDHGLLGITRAEEFGGQGLDWSFACALAEALGEIPCGGVPMALGVQVDMATPALAQYGSDELRREFLAPSITGEHVACIGVSEPGAGSDVAGITTRARKDGDDYVIDGVKTWITNGMQADWTCLLVNTGDGPIHRSKSLIVVPLDRPGVTRVKLRDKLGMHSSDTATLYFEGVRVPQRYRIGEEGRGFVYQMEQFQEERLHGAASSLRGMERAIAQTIEHTSQRAAFGSPLLDNQIIQFKLAELQTKVELLRSIVYRAVEEYVAGGDVTQLASMAKLTAGRLAREVADSCLQFFGGMGYMNETPIARYYRDSRLLSIGAGADEIMLGIIAKGMHIASPAPRASQRTVAPAAAPAPSAPALAVTP
jgi:citronellyl-CoA dehydrogenase